MLIGANTRNHRKRSHLSQQADKVASLAALLDTYCQQLDSLLALNKQMIEKLAALGIRVRVEKTGVKFEAIK